MGVFMVMPAQRGLAHRFRAFLMTGLLGGFTTFSAFSLDTVTLYERGEIGLAAVYVGASVVLSLGAIFAGFALHAGCRRHERRPDCHRRAGRRRPAAGPLARAPFPHVPQGRIEKMCRKGEIRVDGGRVKARDPARNRAEGAHPAAAGARAGAASRRSRGSPTPMPR
jgi:hypothetical protein